MDKSDVFQQTCVAGREFEGVIASTSVPFICCRLTGEGVPLHLAVLEWRPASAHDASTTGNGWWLLRGENGPGIFLARFTTADANKLADEFGIPTAAAELESPAVRQEYFLSSPAWEGLRSWVERDIRDGLQSDHSAARAAWWYMRAVRQIEVLRSLDAQTG
ncbi:hypothetical protein [Paraburkholderia humisilvae]|uniref:Uncharacterized protein n=1 Tax=Paraburkholderia humisilvae TaxID=627669 RepID=A0A6J5DP65_9BURK|nr:hypothetical protein [Paraburkholderia humisilvae]CAB3754626.1 hypothetical protein LMG29542_02403 [Paraburkholderia humisilvae]